jgi:hypothetical protein
MKRTSRKRASRKRTSRNPRSRTTAARLNKIKKLAATVSKQLHTLRHTPGPDLTIEEERRLDSIAMEVGMTREQLGQMPLNKGMNAKVARALGYNH